MIQMKKVQQLILENMQRWVDPLFPVPDSIEITDNVGKRPQIFNSTVPIPSLYSQSNVVLVNVHSFILLFFVRFVRKDQNRSQNTELILRNGTN